MSGEMRQTWWWWVGKARLINAGGWCLRKKAVKRVVTGVKSAKSAQHAA